MKTPLGFRKQSRRGRKPTTAVSHPKSISTSILPYTPLYANSSHPEDPPFEKPPSTNFQKNSSNFAQGCYTQTMNLEIGIISLVGLVAYLGFPYVLGKIRRKRNLKKLNNSVLLGVVYPQETKNKKDKD
jgi:hypothetical protein